MLGMGRSSDAAAAARDGRAAKSGAGTDVGSGGGRLSGTDSGGSAGPGLPASGGGWGGGFPLGAWAEEGLGVMGGSSGVKGPGAACPARPRRVAERPRPPGGASAGALRVARAGGTGWGGALQDMPLQ